MVVVVVVVVVYIDLLVVVDFQRECNTHINREYFMRTE
jgi:hypothetical protein